MAAIKKFKATQVSQLFEHDGRTQDNHEHSNEDIDRSRTHLNYDLCKRSGTAYERYKERMSKVHCMQRDDVNVIDGLIVHLPKDIRAGDERKFFEAVYAFACDDYGEKNIMIANVHNDETRPHIHIDFIPIVNGKRRNGEDCEKVCHNKLITKTYLSKFHGRLSDYVAEKLGYEVSILNGATENGNKTVQKLKADTLAEENAKAEQALHQKKEQALAYDLSSPKKLTESKSAYEERQKVHQKGIALDEEKKAFNERVQNYDKELNNTAIEIAKRLTVKRLEDERDKARAGEQKAVQAHREALARVQELERQNRDLQKQRDNVVHQNNALLGMVEDYHEELTGECIEGEELLKRKLKSQKPKSKQIGR